MDIKVYYDGWQMDCCGKPFSVGDLVKWMCIKSIKGNWIIDVDYFYEAHDDSDYVIYGKVVHIDAIQYEYSKSRNNVLTPISYTRKPIKKCEKFMEEGYVVTLTDVQIILEQNIFE